jgi:hypothetical protein
MGMGKTVATLTTLEDLFMAELRHNPRWFSRRCAWRPAHGLMKR